MRHPKRHAQAWAVSGLLTLVTACGSAVAVVPHTSQSPAVALRPPTAAAGLQAPDTDIYRAARPWDPRHAVGPRSG